MEIIQIYILSPIIRQRFNSLSQIHFKVSSAEIFKEPQLPSEQMANTLAIQALINSVHLKTNGSIEYTFILDIICNKYIVI